MRKLSTYEQYSELLSSFKSQNKRFCVNKFMFKDELKALIDAGKLLYDNANGVLWFLSDEGAYFNAHFYAPENIMPKINAQDKDILVELMGKEDRYDIKLDAALVDAGFEKRSKYVELMCMMDDAIDDICSNIDAMRNLWQNAGFSCRDAEKDDYSAIHKLWMDKLGKDYIVPVLSDTELDEMVRLSRCKVVCDPHGKIVAVSHYIVKNSTCYSYITATYVLGLGGWVFAEKFLGEYSEGLKKDIAWVRDDNFKSKGMSKHIRKPTGKFYWQFILPSNKTDKE